MRKRTVTMIMTGALALPVAGIALATPPSGLTSELLARGAAGEFRIHDENVTMHARHPTDVAVVKATLQPGGTTGWHAHPGPSIVVVKSGAITMSEPGRHGRCDVRTFGPGSAFVHPKHVHDFVNKTTGVVEFYVVYMVPAGAAPLLTDVPTAPAACA
jgi:quercetin dioxygenase-like cupin family protein